MAGGPTEAADLGARIERLRAVALLQTLGDGPLLAIARAAGERALGPGEVVIRQGEPGDALFVVLEGQLTVGVAAGAGPAREVAVLGPGELFGELQAIAGGPRTATVTARTRCTLLQLSRAAFDEAAAAAPEVAVQLTALIRRRLERDLLAAALPAILGPLDPQTLAGLQAEARFVALRAGEVLFEQGDAADAWYVVGSGRLHVLQRGPRGEERLLRELGRGESVGEAALLSGGRRSATVRAARDSELVRFDAARFEALLAQHPQAVLSIARVLVRRQAGAPVERRAAEGCTQIALLPLTPAAAPRASALAGALAAALRSAGPALLLGPERAAELGAMAALPGLPEGHPAWLRFSVWLEERAAGHRFLVFECPDPQTPWGRRALREADELLLVADASVQPPADTASAGTPPAGAALAAARAHPRCTLLLVHPPETSLPSGTARWLAATGAGRHLHTRDGRPGDVARVARLLSGTATALVLGAGGARGAAHLGVLRALGEAGVVIDQVGGTSAGAIAGALFAMGRSPDELAEVNRRMAAARPFGDFTLPISSILAGRRAERAMRLAFGDVRVEDLWLPFFCTSCDTSVFREAVHERGELVPLICAASALPGVLPPRLLDGHMHVDGGTTCALPGAVMRARNPGPLIAVDVSTEREYLVPEARYPTGWAALLRRLFPSTRRPPRPALPELFLRAVSLVTARATDEVAADADLFLRPPVEQYGTSDVGASPEIERIGYEYARERVAAWAAARARAREAG